MKIYSKYILTTMLLLGVSGTYQVCASPLNAMRHDVKANFTFNELTNTTSSLKSFSRYGKIALQMPKMKWRQAETEHFVIHYERKTFAKKTARMAEFMYRYIADELGVKEDRLKEKSHIFIFRSKNAWKKFIQQCPGSMEWSFSFVCGPEMFLQRAGDSRSSAKTLTHEMTHLILYRFLAASPPLWLNEGLAQWYEEFGYAAFKGLKRNKKAPFQPIKQWYPLGLLVKHKTYPTPASHRTLFYKTAHYLTGFLMLEFPTPNMGAFLTDLLEGADVWDALGKHYGFTAPVYLEKKFKYFAQ